MKNDYNLPSFNVSRRPREHALQPTAEEGRTGMTYDWQTTFAQAIHAFGDTPGAQLEQHIRDTFTQHPQAVTNAIAKITDAHQAGRVRSPWGALRTEIDKQVAREAIVDANINPRAAEQRAEQWIRNAGKHFDQWTEAEDELANRPGLRDRWTPALAERLHQLWLEHRVEGELIEAQHEQRMAAWKHNRQRIEQAIRDAKHHEPVIAPPQVLA